eukprot:g28621.t1
MPFYVLSLFWPVMAALLDALRLRLGGGVSGQPEAVDERRLDFQLLICRVSFVVMLAFLSAFELTHLTLVWVGALFAARTLKLFVALGGQGK